MSIDEIESKLSKILINLAKGERNIEISRQVLCENDDYNPIKLFRLLDRENKGYINSNNILSFLNIKGIKATENEVQLLILFYDTNFDKVLSFDEFLCIIQIPNYSKVFNKSDYSPIGFNVSYSFTKLLEKEIELERKIILLLNELRSIKNFNIHDLYHRVKVSNFIEERGIQNFLKKNNESFLDSDVISILKRLDLNKDGVVDLCEFHIFRIPHMSPMLPMYGLLSLRDLLLCKMFL